MLDAAKWFVPTAAGLFAVIGYVVRTAHNGLIGREVDFASEPGYAGAAADFVRDLLTIAVDAMLKAGDKLSLAGHGWEVAAAGALVVAALGLSRIRFSSSRVRAWTAYAPVVALIVLLASKFVLLDAPLMRLENIIIGTGKDALSEQARRPAVWSSSPGAPAAFSRRPGVERTAPGSLAAIDQSATKSMEAASAPSANGMSEGKVQRLISTRAECVYRSLALTRLRQPNFVRDDASGGARDSGEAATVGTNLTCPADAETSADLEEGEFVARILACVLIAVLAFFVVRQRPVWVGIVGFVGLASLLTLPYAYGKLMVPSYFEVGRIVLSQQLRDSRGLDEESKKAGVLDAIVLSRRAAEMDLLVMTPGECGIVTTFGAPASPPAHATYKVARLWTVPNSQVLSVREIYREDVLTWKLRKEFGCDQRSAAPGQPMSLGGV